MHSISPFSTSRRVLAPMFRPDLPGFFFFKEHLKIRTKISRLKLKSGTKVKKRSACTSVQSVKSAISNFKMVWRVARSLCGVKDTSSLVARLFRPPALCSIDRKHCACLFRISTLTSDGRFSSLEANLKGDFYHGSSCQCAKKKSVHRVINDLKGFGDVVYGERPPFFSVSSRVGSYCKKERPHSLATSGFQTVAFVVAKYNSCRRKFLLISAQSLGSSI